MDSVSLTAKKTVYFKMIGAIFSFVLFASIAPLPYFTDYQSKVTFESQVFGSWLLLVGGAFMFKLLLTISALKKDKNTAHMGAIVLGVLAVVSFGFGVGIFTGQYSPLGGTSEQGNLFLATILALSIMMFVAHFWFEVVHHKPFLHALSQL